MAVLKKGKAALFVHHYSFDDDDRPLGTVPTAHVELQAYDLSLSLSVELIRLDQSALDATGVSWDSKIGSYRMKIAAQKGRHAWVGVGSVRGNATRFQFELALQPHCIGVERVLRGSGTVRSHGSAVYCIIRLVKQMYPLSGDAHENSE